MQDATCRAGEVSVQGVTHAELGAVEVQVSSEEVEHRLVTVKNEARVISSFKAICFFSSLL